MKIGKKIFWPIFIVLTVLFIVSAVLKCGVAMTGFLMAAVSIADIYNEKLFCGGLKVYYKSRGRLDKYHRLCLLSFIVFLIVGVIGFALKI